MKSTSKTKGSRKTSLVLTLVLSIGAVIILCNLLQAMLILKTTQKVQVAEAVADYMQIGAATDTALANKVQSYFNLLDFYVKNEVMKEGDINEMAEWLVSVADERAAVFDYVMICGPDGKARTDLDKLTEIQERPYFKAIMKEGKDRYVGNPVFSKTTSKAVVHFARAIKRNGKIEYMLVGVVNMNTIVDEIDNIKIGEAGYAWMLASDGMVMAHPNKEFVMQKNFITGLSKGFEDMADVATKICNRETGNAWVNGLHGGKDLILYRPIAGTTWGFAISVPDKQIYAVINFMTRQLVFYGILTVIILIIISSTMVYRGIRPLNTVKKAVNEIATGNADLTKRIQVTNNNEIGQVVSGFNLFTEKLQTIISDVKSSKNELSIAGSDMTAIAEDTASAITQIIANIESMKNQIMTQSSSVEETAGAVNQIASNISSLERMIETQASGTTQASAAVEEMIGNIASVNNSVEKMAESFENLSSTAQTGFAKQQNVNERIQQIETQSAMLQEANAAISAIAEQTNLLAMNAAIEAAHAGEAGKGFSVVADEIRKLSETSTTQSRTIGEQLNNIKDSINAVVTASSESSQAFEEVSKKIQETDMLVMHIKSAMDEQNEGSRQISEALHSMNDSTVEVRGASAEMSEGNKAILEEVKRLQNATAIMRDSMTEMDSGARKINETGAALSGTSSKVQESIEKIGAQIDEFKV